MKVFSGIISDEKYMCACAMCVHAMEMGDCVVLDQ